MLKKQPPTKEQIALGNRVEEAILSLGKFGKTKIATICDVTDQAVTGWIRTGRISKQNLQIISKESHYSMNWLISETGEKYIPGWAPYIDSVCETVQEYKPKLLIDSSAHSLSDFELIDASTPLSDDEVGLYFFREVECSAGNGRSQVLENNGLKLRFLKSQLKKHNVPEDMAACVTVSGNSMEPVFPDRSIIGIDTSKTTVKNGDLYVIDHNGHLRVKIIYKTPDGGLRLRSFNSDEWPDEHYTKQAAGKIKILGRVFWNSAFR